MFFDYLSSLSLSSFFSLSLTHTRSQTKFYPCRYILNDEGLSVLDVAQSTGHEEVMRLFLKSYCEKNGMQMPPTKLSIESSNEKKKEKNGNGHSSEEKVPSTRQDMRRSRADVMQENLKRARFREEKRERLREEKRARLSGK